MLTPNLSGLTRDQLESRLSAVITKAQKSRMRACPYCTQNDPQFIAQYGHAKIASPAFLEAGRWYHLNLTQPGERWRGGYSWFECKGGWGNGMLVAAGFVRPGLADAVAEAGRILALPDGKLSFQNFMLSAIFIGGEMIVKGGA